MHWKGLVTQDLFLCYFIFRSFFLIAYVFYGNCSSFITKSFEKEGEKENKNLEQDVFKRDGQNEIVLPDMNEIKNPNFFVSSCYLILI